MPVPNDSQGQFPPRPPLESDLRSDGRGTEDGFPDPFGDHDIEWWVWDGARLIPASTEEIYDIEEYERARVAMSRLRGYQSRRRSRISGAYSWLAGIVAAPRPSKWLRARVRPPQAPPPESPPALTQRLKEQS